MTHIIAKLLIALIQILLLIGQIKKKQDWLVLPIVLLTVVQFMVKTK